MTAAEELAKKLAHWRDTTPVHGKHVSDIVALGNLVNANLSTVLAALTATALPAIPEELRELSARLELIANRGLEIDCLDFRNEAGEWFSASMVIAEAAKIVRSLIAAQPLPTPEDVSKQMYEALKPFAKAADIYAPQEDDAHEVWIDAATEKELRFTLGELRRALSARAAYEAAQKGR